MSRHPRPLHPGRCRSASLIPDRGWRAHGPLDSETLASARPGRSQARLQLRQGQTRRVGQAAPGFCRVHGSGHRCRPQDSVTLPVGAPFSQASRTMLSLATSTWTLICVLFVIVKWPPVTGGRPYRRGYPADSARRSTMLPAARLKPSSRLRHVRESVKYCVAFQSIIAFLLRRRKHLSQMTDGRPD